MRSLLRRLPISTPHLGLRLILASMVFCGWGILADEAHASCGDYLHHRGMPEATPEALDDTVTGVAAPVKHRPCSGPGCRQAPPSAPLVPPPVELMVRHDLIACLSRVEASPSLLCGQLEQESEQPLAGHILGILRPPNAA